MLAQRFLPGWLARRLWGREKFPIGSGAPAWNSVAICAIAKNEAPYIAEWALYHRMIGFDHILVYHNDSTDSTEAVLKKLQEAGILQYRNWATPQESLIRRLSRRLGYRATAVSSALSVQRTAYRDGLKRLRRSFEWITFIDIDEFVVIPHVDDIHAFLDRFQDESAIAINWKMFGTSHRDKAETGLVMERFLRCAALAHGGNRAVKTLAKCSALIDPNLHNHQFVAGTRYRTVTGEVVPEGLGRIAGTPTHDIVRINHYFTKSAEEWKAKVARGRATKPAGHPHKFRPDAQFTRYDRNEDFDDYMLRFVPEITQRMSDLGLAPAGLERASPAGPAAPQPAAASSSSALR